MSSQEEEASFMSVENDNDDQNESSDDDETSMRKPPFLPDHKVICCDVNNDQHYYAATVKKVRAISNTEWSFFVHYTGWNSRWDRWCNEKELLEDNTENRNLYLKAKDTAVAQAASVAASKKRKATESQQNRKRKSSAEPKEVYVYEEFCELPFTLHTVLVEEYEEITRKGYDNPRYYDCDLHQNNQNSTQTYRPARNVHKLPAAVTVRQALQQYQRKRGGTNADPTKQEQVRKFCNGLGLLFDDALPVCLLYPEEQPQYESIRSSSGEKRNCEIYGCEYLLRLMVRLPVLLQAEPKNISDMETMAPMISDLIVLLQKNRQACFKNSYREPTYEELLDWEKDLANDSEQQQQSSSSSASVPVPVAADSNIIQEHNKAMEG